MGLLDNLASSLISSSTGLDRRMVRRFVRRAGGGKLLMLGGAVLAGAVGSEVMEQKRPATPPPPPGGGSAPPPLPPGAMPDLPPLPHLPAEAHQAEAAEATLPPDLLYAVLRTMVAAALADGTLSAEEKQAVDAQLDASTEELPPERLRQIHRDLVLPPSPEDLAELPGAGEDPELLFRFALLVLRADGHASETEEEWLERLGRALAIDPDRRQALATEVAGG